MSPFQSDAPYRTVEEARILELLILYGWVHEIRCGERAAATEAASDALDRWVRLGLPFQTKGGKRYFDPAEVVNFFKWAGIDRGDPFWEKRFVGTGRKLILSHHNLETAEDAPPDPAHLVPAQFSMSLSREFNLRTCEPGASIRLRLPLPLEDETLHDLKVEPISPPHQTVRFEHGPGRLDVRLAVPRSGTVTLGVRLSFTANPANGSAQPGTLDPSDIELYTRPNEGLVRVTPRILALAWELAGETKEAADAIQSFWNFLLDRLTCGVVHYDELSAVHPLDWVLENGWFDCQLGSALLVALCRARGIPARIVSGYLLYPVSPSYHYWAEAWVDGRWLPLDPICSDLSARGRDRTWRDYFFGRLDYRMKTQCLPRLFDTTPTVRLPASWHILARADGDGVETGFFENKTGAPVYRDVFSVRRRQPG